MLAIFYCFKIKGTWLIVPSFKNTKFLFRKSEYFILDDSYITLCFCFLLQTDDRMETA